MSQIQGGKDTPNYDFWTIQQTGKSISVHFENDKLIEFCSKVLGFYNYIDYTGNYIRVRVTNHCIVEETRTETLKHCIKNYLRKERKLEIVWAQFAQKNLLTEHVLDLIEILPETNYNISTKDEAFVFYQNGIISIKIDGFQFVEYKNFKGHVWKQQIIPRQFINGINFNGCVFDKFLRNVCGQDRERHVSLMSILGYLLHPYKDPSFSKAVIMLDEKVDFTGDAHGGTGKSLIAKAIEQITPTVWKDGKKYNPNETFVYDDIRPYHRVLYFDDVKKSFHFEEFYSLITGNLKVNRKYRDSTTIPQSLTPKLLISSNYMIKGTGGDTDLRRRIEFEISPYYSKEFTPKDEFNHIFFNDWDADEWQRFDTMMIYAIRYFIKHGVIEPQQINLEENRLKVETDPEFVTFLGVKVEAECSYNKAELLDEFKRLCPAQRNLSAITFKTWIDKWAKSQDYKVRHRKSNGNGIVDFYKQE